jgi:hypothetical protein
MADDKASTLRYATTLSNRRVSNELARIERKLGCMPVTIDEVQFAAGISREGDFIQQFNLGEQAATVLQGDGWISSSEAAEALQLARDVLNGKNFWSDTPEVQQLAEAYKEYIINVAGGEEHVKDHFPESAVDRLRSEKNLVLAETMWKLGQSEIIRDMPDTAPSAPAVASPKPGRQDGKSV